MCKKEKLTLLSGVSDSMMEAVGECVMYWIGKWWLRRKDLYGELIWSPALAPL